MKQYCMLSFIVTDRPALYPLYPKHALPAVCLHASRRKRVLKFTCAHRASGAIQFHGPSSPPIHTKNQHHPSKSNACPRARLWPSMIVWRSCGGAHHRAGRDRCAGRVCVCSRDRTRLPRTQLDAFVNLIRCRRFFVITANHLLVAQKIITTALSARLPPPRLCSRTCEHRHMRPAHRAMMIFS